MTKDKQKPLPLPADYRLLITHKYSPQKKRVVVFVGLRTIEEFSTFRYDVLVRETFDGVILKLEIHGLKAPKQTFPSHGPAVYSSEYDGLTGLREVLVTKADGQENKYQVQLTADSVQIKKGPPKPFCQLVTSEEEW